GGAKLDAEGHLALGDVTVLRGEAEPMRACAEAIATLRPDAILDLSDEPVLGYERRMQMVAVALRHGIPYLGPDFRFEPPVTEPPLAVATVAVVGTGKRVGKTAVSAHLARTASQAGHGPWVVAMGRGGPPTPSRAEPGDVSVEGLLARVARGEHAASDFLEDAVAAAVPT